MAKLTPVDTGVVFRNPKPHLRSVHAYFPWVTTLPSGELISSFQVGSAFEAADAHAEYARSKDGGRTWVPQGRLYPGTGPEAVTSDCFKITCDPQGRLIAFGSRFDRPDPEEALCNEETGGIVPVEVLQFFSEDEGHTWDGPHIVDTPIPGPFEAQAPVVVLSDGRWIVPMSTWRAWDGSHPNGDKCIALISHDKGRTWPTMATMFEDPLERLVFWEVRIAELPSGSLLAVAWAHDKIEAKDIPSQYAFSHDGGVTWEPFAPTGFNGQSCCPAVLPDGRVLFAYNHRYGEPGVRLRLAYFEGEEWVTEDEIVLWGVGSRGDSRQAEKMMVHEMSSFKFGQPSPHLLADGSILTVHWCVDGCVGEIRWNKIEIG